MDLLLGQAAEVATLGSKAIDASAQYGGEVWLLSIVLLSIGILGGIWIWQVSIPNQRSARDNTAKLTEAVITLTSVTGATHQHVVTTSQDMTETKAAVRSLCRSKVIEADILTKLADKADLDINSELGELKGINQASADMVSVK